VTPQLTINLDHFANDFVAGVSTRLVSHRQVVHSVREGSFDSKATAKPSDGVISLSISGAFDQTYVTEQSARDCFRDTWTIFVRFVDQFLGAQDLLAAKVVVPTAMTLEQAVVFAQQELNKTIKAVASNTALTTPAKLERLEKANLITDDQRAILLGYNQARRHIEHHGGLTDEELKLTVRRMKFFAGDDEIKSLPVTLGAGQSLQLKILDDIRVIPANSRITVREDELDAIYTFLQGVVGEIIRKSVASNAPATAPPAGQP